MRFFVVLLLKMTTHAARLVPNGERIGLTVACACLCVIGAAGPAGAATNYYYVGGVKPVGLGVEGTDYVWTNSGVNAAYDWIMDQDNANNVWEIRVATNYSEALTAGTRVAMDGLKTGGAASAGKVSGIYGARVWDASTSSHSAVDRNYNNKSVLDGNYSFEGALISITSKSNMSVGPTIEGFKLTHGVASYPGDAVGHLAGGVYVAAAVDKTTLSRLEICNNRTGAHDGGAGMGLWADASDCLVTDCYIHDNTILNDTKTGHGETVIIGGLRTLVRNTKICTNRTGYGAGITMQQDSGAMLNCEISGNTVLSGTIASLGRGGQGPVGGSVAVNVLLAENGPAAGYDAKNFGFGLGGYQSADNIGYFVNMTIVTNRDTVAPLDPGIYLYGGNQNHSHHINCVFCGNGGITNITGISTKGGVAFCMSDDSLPTLSYMVSNLTATAQFAGRDRPDKYRLRFNSTGTDAGGYVKEDTRGGKAFKYVDVNRNGVYDILRDVIVWHEAGFAVNPPLTGGNFDIVATEDLGTWDEYGNYTPGNPRLIGAFIDMGAYETAPPRGTVVMVK